MTTIRWAILFFGLIIALWLSRPAIENLFDKKERQKIWKEVKEEMKEEEHPTTEEWKKKKLAKEQKMSVLKPIIIIVGALILWLIFWL